MRELKQYILLAVLWFVVFIEVIVVYLIGMPPFGTFLFGFSLGIVLTLTIKRQRN